MGKKIGIIAKNYKFLEETLKRNIGDGNHKFDKYGGSPQRPVRPQL